MYKEKRKRNTRMLMAQVLFLQNLLVVTKLQRMLLHSRFRP
jgi:predicted nucleic acid-binding Zn ribbon protein